MDGWMAGWKLHKVRAEKCHLTLAVKINDEIKTM
jgi:hypothetical protein